MNDRGRGARHPLQMSIMLSLTGIGCSQLLQGADASAPVMSLPDAAQRSFAVLLLISAGLVLAGAVLAEPRSYWVELAGQLGGAVALTVYTVTLKSTVPQWNTSMGSGFGFIALGCYARVVWLSMLIVANFYPAVFRRFARAYVTLRRRG